MAASADFRPDSAACLGLRGFESGFRRGQPGLRGKAVACQFARRVQIDLGLSHPGARLGQTGLAGGHAGLRFGKARLHLRHPRPRLVKPGLRRRDAGFGLRQPGLGLRHARARLFQPGPGRGDAGPGLLDACTRRRNLCLRFLEPGAGFGHAGPGLREPRLRLLQRHLPRAGIDDAEHVALVDHRAAPKRRRDDLAACLGTHLHLAQGLRLAPQHDGAVHFPRYGPHRLHADRSLGKRRVRVAGGLRDRVCNSLVADRRHVFLRCVTDKRGRRGRAREVQQPVALEDHGIKHSGHENRRQDGKEAHRLILSSQSFIRSHAAVQPP
jgi:hypothetical protein